METNNNNITCSSTSPTAYHNQHHQLPCSSDEISRFLRQILVRSSSTSSSTMGAPQEQSFSFTPENPPRSCFLKDGISAVESSVGVNGSDGGDYLLSSAYLSGNVRGSAATSSLGASENETDEYDCESEEGFEALVDEAPAKAAPPRGSSKRSRAAEVHNLSEKRRRSRINEKMKALQNLIPNSNKTDKASMLDEAIEYLKQLQLQVQMLSMRNGLSLHPMCLPGALQPIQLSQMRMGFGEENGSLQINMTGTLPQETSTQAVFTLPNQCSASNQLSVPNMSNIINSETSFGMESSIHAHFGPFQLHTSAEEICREDILPHQQLNVNHSETNPSEFEIGATATVSLPFDTHASNPKDSSSLGACMIGRDQSEGALLKNRERNLILSPHLTGTQSGRSALNDDIKIERPDF